MLYLKWGGHVWLNTLGAGSSNTAGGVVWGVPLPIMGVMGGTCVAQPAKVL